jgi:hypothetical protein
MAEERRVRPNDKRQWGKDNKGAVLSDTWFKLICA